MFVMAQVDCVDKTFFLMVLNNIDGMWYFTIDLQDGKLTFMDRT